MQTAVMAVNMTIRNVPQDVRDELAARAARSGQSLQEYVRSALIGLAEKPDLDQLMAEAAADARRHGTRLTTDQIVGSIRDGRADRA